VPNRRHDWHRTGENGTHHALVVHGDGGLDEIALGPTICYEIREGQEPRRFTIMPEEFGLPAAPISEIRGGSLEESADIIRRVLRGELGPHRDVVLLNAGAALYVGGLAPDLREGIALAAAAIDSGAAARALAAFVAASNGPIPAGEEA